MSCAKVPTVESSLGRRSGRSCAESGNGSGEDRRFEGRMEYEKGGRGREEEIVSVSSVVGTIRTSEVEVEVEDVAMMKKVGKNELTVDPPSRLTQQHKQEPKTKKKSQTKYTQQRRTVCSEQGKKEQTSKVKEEESNAARK